MFLILKCASLPVIRQPIMYNNIGTIIIIITIPQKIPKQICNKISNIFKNGFLIFLASSFTMSSEYFAIFFALFLQLQDIIYNFNIKIGKIWFLFNKKTLYSYEQSVVKLKNSIDYLWRTLTLISRLGYLISNRLFASVNKILSLALRSILPSKLLLPSPYSS